MREQFRKIRKSKGYTQKKLGEWLGRTRRSVNGYESGKKDIPTTVKRLMEYLEKEALNT